MCNNFPLVKSPEKVSKFEKLKASLILQKNSHSPTNTPLVFHVETTCKRPFPLRFNVEYTWSTNPPRLFHVETWKTRGVFVGVNLILIGLRSLRIIKSTY